MELNSKEHHNDTTIEQQEREDMDSVGAESVPAGYYTSPNFLGTLLGIGLGIFTGTSSFALPAGALATINKDIGPDPNYVWIGLVNTLMLAIGYTIVGRVTDLCGRRYFIIGGNAVGVIGTIISATAKSIPILIGGNVLMGLAASTQTSTPALLGELLPMKHRFAITGLFFTIFVLPNTFGAAISHAFVENTAGGWRNLYWLLLATNAASCCLIFVFYHPPTFAMKNSRTKMQAVKDFDYVGFFLFSGGLTTFLLGLSWGGQVYPWDSARVIACLVVGGVVIVAFVLYECYMPLKDPLVPMRLFRNYGWVVTVLVLGIGPTIFYGFAIVWPQMVFGLYTTDVKYGSLLSVIPTVAFTGGTCCSAFVRYIRKQRIQIIVCASIGAPLVAACACMTVDNRDTIIGLMFTGCFFLGYIEGAGVTATAVSLEDQADIGVGSGVAATLRGVFATFGAAIYVLVLRTRLTTTIPQQVPPALIRAGLPVSSIPAFIAAFQTGEFAKIPGVSASIIQAGTLAYDQAQVLAYRTVFLTTLAFSGPILILSFFWPDLDKKMTNHTAAFLHTRKDKADLERNHVYEKERAETIENTRDTEHV
ncbi:fungal trichothecene efflux pump [Paraphoma chrysanthemicola]|uniref:Fungal trichothecene efflux pump n=1 Tax=Paraphoma chrysanthemicola TaxID=798071 RepID=A0A8K0R594_9PLEO|nr:fungal trichothecene efflux pump [Paraphoma chrysanthemicola]